MHVKLICCILLAVTQYVFFRWDQPEIRQADVFTSGLDGYHTYRIPAIETAPDGSLLAFAEARKYNGADPGMEENDIDLVMKRSSDGGMIWSSMKVIEDPGERSSAANPATVVDKTNGRTWLFYIRSKPGRSSETARAGTEDMQTLARTSGDNGVTWSEPIDLTKVVAGSPDPATKTRLALRCHPPTSRKVTPPRRAKGNVKVLPARAHWRADFEIGVLTAGEAQRLEQKIDKILSKR